MNKSLEVKTGFFVRFLGIIFIDLNILNNIEIYLFVYLFSKSQLF
jgi:hypothetical protein